MTHLMVCREYPPAPAGGIGTYTAHMARLLAEAGETVHVISQLGRGGRASETDFGGRLVVHRIPRASATAEIEAALLRPYPPQHFSWQASLMAERLVEEEGVDLIEGPEYEAPLYYFQIRRALGLGPRRKPAVMVHFHSPTELIVRFNEGDPGIPAHVTAKRLEDYSIAAADGWLCPSRYLAGQAEAIYGLPSGAVTTIPYPLGAQACLDRDPETWARGTICFVGRLETRKGVVEWIEAAVAVAHDHPEARFEFVGRNILDGRWLAGNQLVTRLIPERVRRQFVFRGEQPRQRLPHHLARARIAVVPSRWDNFPNACMEAMASGLPVIASREGGMVEMLRDGSTGWLARPDPIGLAEALRRALATPATMLAAMGRRAAADIRSLCDNDQIVARHLELYRTLGATGAKGSLAVPAILPWVGSGHPGVSTKRTQRPETGRGVAVVITCSAADPEITECLLSLTLQSRTPEVVVVSHGATTDAGAQVIEHVRAKGWRVTHQAATDLWSARTRGIETLLEQGSRPLGVVFLEPDDRLHAEFVATAERVLEQCPGVGVVSCWTRSLDATERVRARPCPAFPYQWLWNDAAACSAVRREALAGIGQLGPSANRAQADWLLVTAVMTQGWAAVTVPEILGSHRPAGAVQSAPSAIRRELLDRFPDVAARDAPQLVLLACSPGAVWLREEELSARDYVRMAWEARGRYGRVVRWILAKLRLELTERLSRSLAAWRWRRWDGDGSGR